MFFKYKPIIGNDGKKYVTKIYDGKQFKNVIPHIYIEPTDLEVLVSGAHNDFYDNESKLVYVYPYGQLKSVDEIQWYYKNDETYKESVTVTQNNSASNLYINNTKVKRVGDNPCSANKLQNFTTANIASMIITTSNNTISYSGLDITCQTMEDSAWIACKPTADSTVYFYAYLLNDIMANNYGVEPGIYLECDSTKNGYVSKLTILFNPDW